MTLSRQEAIYGAVLGALVGLAYAYGRQAWAGAPLAEVTLTEALASAAVGAAAGLLAFLLRRR